MNIFIADIMFIHGSIGSLLLLFGNFDLCLISAVSAGTSDVFPE